MDKPTIDEMFTSIQRTGMVVMRNTEDGLKEDVGGEMKGFDYLPKGAFNVEDGSVVAAGAAFFSPDGEKTGQVLLSGVKHARKLEGFLNEPATDLHPEQDRYPGRLVDEGIIEYRLRMAEKK